MSRLVFVKGDAVCPARSLTSEQVLTLLAAAPPRIAALTAGLLPAQLIAAPNHGEWSANEVLARPARVCGRVGQLHVDDGRPGQADTAGCQSPYLDRKDELSRTRVQTLAPRFHRAAARTIGSSGTAASQSLVTDSHSDGGGKVAPTDRAVLRAMVGRT